MSRHDRRSTPPPMISRRSMRRGLAGFIAFTLAGLGILFVFTLGGDLSDVARNLSGGFFALAALAVVGDSVLGGLRYHVFLRKMRPGTRLGLSIRADLVGRFTGAVTPSQTGGGPGQIFVLYRGGIPMPDLLSVLMVNFVSTLVFFLAAGGAAAWLLGSQFSGSAIRHLIRWTFVALAGGLVFIVVSVTRPDLLARPIHRMTRRLDGDPRAWAQTLRRVGQVLVDSAERYKASCVRCFREWPLLPVASLVLTALLYLNKFTLAWFIVRGLGVDESYTTVLAVQTLLHFVLYVAPTPGGGGLGELSTGAIMAPVLPTYLLPAFTVAFRLFLTYLPAAVGAFVLARMVPRARTVAPALRVGVGAVAVAVAASALAADASARQVKLRQAPTMVPLADATHHRRAKLVRHALAQGLRAACRDDSLWAFDLAVDTASALVREDPHDAEAHYLYSVALGQRLELAGTREKIRLGALTRAAAETALEIDPDHAGAHHVLGRLHAGTMRMSSFVRFVARRILGAEALAGASWERAEHHFTRARDLEPWNPRHSMELGVLYADTGRPGLALEALNAAIDLPRARLTDAPAVDRAMRVRAELIAVPSSG